jgi:hypothetical protein
MSASGELAGLRAGLFFKSDPGRRQFTNLKKTLFLRQTDRKPTISKYHFFVCLPSFS